MYAQKNQHGSKAVLTETDSKYKNSSYVSRKYASSTYKEIVYAKR